MSRDLVNYSNARIQTATKQGTENINCSDAKGQFAIMRKIIQNRFDEYYASGWPGAI